MSNTRKEIRIYIDLNNEVDKAVYNFLQTKKSPSMYVIDKIYSDLEKSGNIIFYLEEIAKAIKELNTISILPGTTEEVTESELKFKLEDNFDDEY